MLTLFSAPKPFLDHHGVIQRNAIQSWTLLRPRCEILLFGEVPGLEAVARNSGVLHKHSVRCNEFGTPLLDSLFQRAEAHASFAHLCYVNSDIILLSDFLVSVRRVLSECPRSLIVGRRWDVPVDRAIDFSETWEDAVRRLVRQHGRLHAHTGIDYFVFPKGMWREIPPFAVGRTAWDGWLVYRARSDGLPVVDLTPSTMVVHQNHDYSHHPRGWMGVWKGEEAIRNQQLAGGYSNIFTVWDATQRLTQAGLRKVRLHPYRLYRLLVTHSKNHRALGILLRAARRLRE